MTDQNNQGQKIRLHKNERHSATQVDSGGLPVVPVNTGKNYYSSNRSDLPKLFDLDLHDPQNNDLLAIKITGTTLQKLFNSAISAVPGEPNFIEPDFEGIGFWFDKRTETGSFLVDFYFVTGAGPYTKYQFAETLQVDVTDIDKGEEIIFRLPTFKVQLDPAPASQTVTALYIVFRPAEGYQTEHPIKVGNQHQPMVDFRLTEITDSQTIITENSIYPLRTPMTRLYVAVERAVRISDPEGNAIKPNCPFSQMLIDNEFTISGTSPVRMSRRWEMNDTGIVGAVRAGRIKKIRFEIMPSGGVDPPDTIVLRIKRGLVSSPFVSDLTNVNELFVGSITSPLSATTFIAAKTANYFEYHGAHLSKQGIENGLIIRNQTGGLESQIFRIEEGLELIPPIGGVLTPVTRIWAQRVNNPNVYELAQWAANDLAHFRLWGGGAGLPGIEWLVDIPYQIMSGADPNFYIPYEIWCLDPPSGSVNILCRTMIHVEEDNMILRVNPGRSVAGSEDLDRKW